MTVSSTKTPPATPTARAAQGPTGPLAALEALRSRLTATQAEPGTSEVPDVVDAATLDDDFLVCHCTNVTAGEIRDVIRTGTASSLDEVQRCTRAGGGCGKCVPLLTKLVHVEIGEPPARG